MFYAVILIILCNTQQGITQSKHIIFKYVIIQTFRHIQTFLYVLQKETIPGMDFKVMAISSGDLFLKAFKRMENFLF